MCRGVTSESEFQRMFSIKRRWPFDVTTEQGLLTGADST